MKNSSKTAVLVVDDDEDIRHSIADLLEAEGFRPVAAADGRQALDELQHLPRPCAVVLDLMMPVMDGHEFLQRVRARPALTADVRVVVCTAAASLPAQEPPVHAVLKKPFKVDELLEVLEQLSGA